MAGTERKKAYDRVYARIHKEEKKAYKLWRDYNLTFAQIDDMLIKQDHKCAICEKLLEETKRNIDHDHKTGKVRGLLCDSCNVKLSGVEDKEFLAKAFKYLT